MKTTYLTPADRLPLTCSRSGTCCHGKMVWLNPWELACLAAVKGVTSREFRDRYCEFGGIQLRFDGTSTWQGFAACSMYLPGTGCTVHAGRPLACRLYPLGRERRAATIRYMHRGSSFPCLEGCPEVTGLPLLSVEEYCRGQEVAAGEAAQDAYIELMQHLADGAFALLIESGLAASGDRQTLRRWRTLGNSTPAQLTEYIGAAWLDRLMLPDITGDLRDPAPYVQRHHDLLQAHAQTSFGTLGDAAAVREASGLMMGLSLHLGRGLGINPADLATGWIATAKELGAQD